MDSIGRTSWVISDGWIQPDVHQEVGRIPRTQVRDVRDAVCLLNAGESDAAVTMMIFFANRSPAGPYQLTVRGQRVLYEGFRDVSGPEVIPMATDFCAVLTSDVPIIVQHIRQQIHDDVVTTEPVPAFAN